MVDAEASTAAARGIDRHGDVTTTEYVPHSGQTCWSVTGPAGTFLVTPDQAGFSVGRSDSLGAEQRCATVEAAIGAAARRASALPAGRPGNDHWLGEVSGGVAALQDGETLRLAEVRSRDGDQLAEAVAIDHTAAGAGPGEFTVRTVCDSPTPTGHAYGPSAGPGGEPISKEAAARRAAEDAAGRQQPSRCGACGRYTPTDGHHACPASAGGPLTHDLDTPHDTDDADREEVPEGLPAGDYGDLKGDERVKAMVADLEESVKAVIEGGQLQRWLEAMSSNGLHRWSANNRLLALVQMLHRGEPLDGLHLMGFRQWEKHNRKVSKGAKAVWILAPITRKIVEEDDAGAKTEKHRVVGFKSVAVFNVSDTHGEPMPESPGRPAPGEATTGTLAGLRDRVGRAGYSYEETEIPGCRAETGEGTLGYTDPQSKRIVVDSRLSNAQKASTIAHELGHVHCGHVDGDHSEYRKHRGRMETEAEMAAYLVNRSRGMSRAQVDSFSPAYIAGWSKGDAKVMHAAVNKAVRAHNKILEGDWPTN